MTSFFSPSGSISLYEKQLHEAMFEVISSEASYLKSLNVLVAHFVEAPKLAGEGPTSPSPGQVAAAASAGAAAEGGDGGAAVISKRDHRLLFGDVSAIRRCSQLFLSDLERLWQASALMEGLSAVVGRHAGQGFRVYVRYCSNQVHQDKTLRKLR